MNMPRICLVMICLVMTVAGCQTRQPDDTGNAVKILLIGSSHMNFNDLAGMLRSICSDRNRDVLIQTSLRNGLSLSGHTRYFYTADKLKEEKWDYVILQGGNGRIAYPDEDPMNPLFPALEKLKAMILDNHSATTIVFWMAWAYEDGNTFYGGSDGYPEMQQKIFDNTIDYADKLDFVIAPVGWAWQTVLAEKNYPLHYLHMDDWSHPNIKGSYLMACVIYSSLFRERITGMSYRSELSETDANYFQTIASDTVLNDLERWNLL